MMYNATCECNIIIKSLHLSTPFSLTYGMILKMNTSGRYPVRLSFDLTRIRYLHDIHTSSALAEAAVLLVNKG